MYDASLFSFVPKTRLLPVAFVAVNDDERRRGIADALRKDGWAVVESTTGYHLVETLSGLILGERPWHHPHLVVVDAHSPGCSGITISRGLRELGWDTPVILLGEQDSGAIDDLHASDGCAVIDRDTPLSVIRALATQCREQRRKEVDSKEACAPLRFHQRSEPGCA